MAELKDASTATQDSVVNTTERKYSDEAPPPFGHPMLKCFGFEPGYINLNHGSYGSLPLPVLEATDKLTREIEANPDRFLRFTFIPLVHNVRARLASMINVDADECVLVPNATHGVNTILHNFAWAHGDAIVGASTTYGAVSRTIQYFADTAPHPSVYTFPLRFPQSHATIVKNFRDFLGTIPRQQDTQILVVIDAIVANPGARLPWEELVKICKEEKVFSLVDAAHSIGQQLDIDLKAIDPDFWVSNCHKWLYAKRGCALLYVPKRNQHMIKTSLPTSFEYVSPIDPPGSPEAPNFVKQFEWTGTIDMVPYLSVSPALDFRQWLGGEKHINDYCHRLALEGGKKLAEVLGTRVIDEDGELTLNMVNVELPLQGVGPSAEVNAQLREALLYDWNTYAAHYYHGGSWWTRCSAQIWNEVSDFEYIGKAFVSICSKIREEYQSEVQGEVPIRVVMDLRGVPR